MKRKTNKTKTEFLNLQEFFERKQRIEEDLKKELESQKDQLLGLVPDGLKKYVVESLFSYELWLQELYSKTLSGHSMRNKIQELRSHGFKGKKDTLRKLRLLKTAWKDVIKVEVSDEEWRIIVYFTLVLKK